jgi:L-lactate dehydrogenase complex protein LldG
MDSRPAGRSDMLWSLFESKARGLGATVIHTSSLAETVPQVATQEEFVARGDAAIAETGSVLVCLPQPDRAAALLAEHLWLVLRSADILPNLDEALVRVQAYVASGGAYAMLMSGPSRTADIERALTIGVHGPRALTIVVLDEESLGAMAPAVDLANART